MKVAASLKKPVDYDELFPGRFLKAGLFQGKKPTLTIADVNIEELPDEEKGTKVKGIISFQNQKLQLVLNKTNGECIKAMFGRSVSGWVGKRVTLFASKWQGDDCIRVWGSPDIEKEFTVTVQLPKRRPIEMVMHKIAAKEAAPPPEPANPDNDGR